MEEEGGCISVCVNLSCRVTDEALVQHCSGSNGGNGSNGANCIASIRQTSQATGSHVWGCSANTSDKRHTNLL